MKNTRPSNLRVLVYTAIAAAVTTVAHAQTLSLIDPLTATGGIPTTPNTGTDNTPTNLINNSGMSSDALGTPGGVVTVNTSNLPTANEDDSSGGGVGGGFRATYTNTDNSPIVFALNTGLAGASNGYFITGLYIYNLGELYNGNYQTGGNTSSFDLQYSTNGGSTYIDYGTVNLSPAISTSPNDPGMSYALSAPLSGVTDIEFVNLFSTPSSTNVGLAEVRFEGVAPEPSAWALVLCGLLGMGGLSFFRHRLRA